MKHLTSHLLLSAFLLFSFNAVAAEKINIVPKPLSVTAQEGAFALSAKTSINLLSTDTKLKLSADFFNDLVKKTFSKGLKVGESKSLKSNAINANINSLLGDEEYTLAVDNKQISIEGGSPKAVFYAFQTLRQLLPVSIEKGAKMKSISIPAVIIKDKPDFAYRGGMLDVCRHFFTVAEVKKYIDILSLHKMNTFHWHLTDDQGWRIEIKKYPKLTQVGSIRNQTKIGHYSDEKAGYDNTPYGGFYTQKQIKEIVKYASDKFITVIPEIEMPGHGVAALTSYPYLGCVGKNYKLRETWGISDEVYCPGKETTFQFIEDVLTEVIDLFPSEYIHIGGDECPKGEWEKCPSCQKRIKDEGLKNELELQSYLVLRIEKFVNSKGRKIIGWDEILEGGLSKTATVMSWRGSKGGIEAAKRGNHVIMAPNTYCYLDYYQTGDSKNEPLGIGGNLPVEKVYALNPYQGLNAEECKYISGVQGNLWTEYIATIDHVEYMLLPRLAAIGEIGWALSRKDYPDFWQRMQPMMRRYDALGYRSAKHILKDKPKAVYTPAQDLTLIGKAMPTQSFFHRVDTAKYADMPKTVKNLFTHSAGLAICFKTNSPSISARWCVSKRGQNANLTPIAQKGLDLYIKKEGKWQFAGVGSPKDECTERNIVDNMDNSEKECLLYLPLYDETKKLEIGVSPDSYIQALENPFKKTIAVYGSSILQGASASRSGMAYAARLSRETGFNFINLGLSGNGKMEKPVADMLADIPADAFILDCIPNPSPKEITERAAICIQTIRDRHPETPIIVIQTLIREKGYFDQKVGDRVKKQNLAIAKEVKALQDKGMKNLYFIEEDEFQGTDHEGSVDGVHPNDLGFDRMIEKIRPQIMEVLKKHKIYL